MSIIKSATLALLAIHLTFISAHSNSGLELRATNGNVRAVCQEISQSISGSSDVIYALASNFTSDIHHWYQSSTQVPYCVLEAGSAEDVATAIKIIGANQTPFAIKSGGHASNPGFSSTTGVHISFNRMTQVNLSPDKSTIEIGMGQTWSTVYQALHGSGVNVVGGRTVGPGVGGFTLGGGFSWKTNQYGLTVDTVESYTLVLPNGTITKVDSSTPDLFFALKGGLNRFGIVTSIVYNTHAQSDLVYGGLVIYDHTKIPAVLNATIAFFNENEDPKAQLITTLNGGPTGVEALVLFFYDGPTKPASFDVWDGIIPLASSVKVQSFADLIEGFPSELEVNLRGTFNTLSTSALTPGFLAAVHNETNYYSSISALYSGSVVAYDIEPFLTTYGQHATDSAYPHSGSPLPLNLEFAWTSEQDDAFWYESMKESVARLTQIAIAEDIYSEDMTAYPNYAISNTTAEELYGATNAARLSVIRSEFDPDNVMELAGGFAL